MATTNPPPPFQSPQLRRVASFVSSLLRLRHPGPNRSWCMLLLLLFSMASPPQLKRSSHIWYEPPSTQAPGHQQQLQPRPHGVASSTQRSSLLQSQPPPAPVFRPQQQQPQPPLVTHGVACATPSAPASRAQRGLLRFEHDLLNFFFTKRVPEGLEEHVTSSKKAQVEWYRNILEARPSFYETVSSWLLKKRCSGLVLRPTASFW